MGSRYGVGFTLRSEPTVARRSTPSTLQRSRPAEPTMVRRGSAPPTTPTTTALTCSTPTATTSKPSATSPSRKVPGASVRVFSVVGWARIVCPAVALCDGEEPAARRPAHPMGGHAVDVRLLHVQLPHVVSRRQSFVDLAGSHALGCSGRTAGLVTRREDDRLPRPRL